MPVDVKKLPNEPIVHVTLSNPFSIKDDVPKLASELTKVFDTTDGPLWDVTDVRDLSVPFGDIVMGTSTLTKGDLGVLRNPKIKRFAIVTSGGAIKLASKALGQLQYGALPTSVVDTLEEAFDIVRKEIKDTAK